MKKTVVKSAALAVFILCAAVLTIAFSVRADGVIPLYSSSFSLSDTQARDTGDLFQTGGLEQAFRNPQDIPAAAKNQVWQVVRMRVTAYCPCRRCCGRFADGQTACMHKIRQGDKFTAADRKVPFGTEMIIPGYNGEKPVEVRDRGRLIRGNRLDVFFNSHAEAKKWGTKYLDVLVKTD